MKLNIFTDPHLGVSRKAHTTATSSARLNDALFEQALSCKRTETPNFIAGDLFDKSHNNERVIAQAIDVATGAIVLAGNHDMSNRADDVTSLQLVETALPDSVVITPEFDKPYYAQVYPGVFAVPHHASQELFMEALAAARDDAAEIAGRNYLFVHCNRGQLPTGQDAPDSILVLPEDIEAELLKTFQCILYGHEHRPADYHDGRVIVLGNTHPTGFADISDKYRYVLDTDTGDVEQHLIWSKDEHYADLEIGDPLPSNPALQFIDVHGFGTRQDVAKYMQEVWDTYPNAFAVRSLCQYDDAVGGPSDSMDFHDIPAMIDKDLEGTDLLPLLRELKEGLA